MELGELFFLTNDSLAQILYVLIAFSVLECSFATILFVYYLNWVPGLSACRNYAYNP